MKQTWILLFAIVLGTCSGCSHFDGADVHALSENSSASVVFFNPDSRATIAIPNEAQHLKYKFCSEQASDVAFNKAMETAQKVSVSTNGVDIGAENAYQLANTAVLTAQKSQGVLFLREAMYRLCEMSLNNTLDKAELKNMWDGVLKTAQLVSKTEMAAHYKEALATASGSGQPPSEPTPDGTSRAIERKTDTKSTEQFFENLLKY